MEQQNPTSNRYLLKHLPWRHAALLVVLLFAVARLLFFLQIPVETDPGCFQSIAFALSRGMDLYTDVWDHKPPGIFYFNLLALKLFGSNQLAIFWLQIITTMLTALVLFLILEKLTGYAWLAMALGLGFFYVWIEPGKFGSGNYTEQYGVFFVLLGHWQVIGFLKDRGKFLKLLPAAWWMGVALLFKESFLFTSLPLVLLSFIAARKQWKPALILGFTTTFLILLPTAFFASYFVVHGNWGGYLSAIDHTMAYAGENTEIPLFSRLWLNFHYIDGRVTHSMTLMLLAALPGLYFFKKMRHKAILVYFLLVFVMEFIATGLPGNFYDHYYLQITPTIFILCAILLANGWKAIPASWVRYPILGMLVALALPPSGLYTAGPKELARQLPRKTENRVVDYIQSHSQDSDKMAIAHYDLGRYYLQSQRLPASRFAVPFNYHLIQGGMDKARENMRQLRANKPKFVVAMEPHAQFLYAVGFNEWLASNYVQILNDNGVLLWQSK